MKNVYLFLQKLKIEIKNLKTIEKQVNERFKVKNWLKIDSEN